MTEQTETERAIEALSDIMPYLKGDPNEPHFATAISALKQQSEAERRIERIKSLCAEQGCELGGEGFEWSDGCAAGRVALSEEILEILEGNNP